VTGSVIAFEAGTDINTAAAAARDAADDILDEVLGEIETNDTMTDTVRDVTVSGQKWQQGWSPEGQQGRFCRVEFTLHVEA
jgi:hypothetical protein